MAFKKMNNLKRLIIESGSFTTGPNHLPNSLRVLEWWDYPSPSLPIDFHPKKLVKLELLGSCLMSLDLFMSKKVCIQVLFTALCIKIEFFFLLPSFFCAFYNIHFADKKNAAH